MQRRNNASRIHNKIKNKEQIRIKILKHGPCVTEKVL